VHICCQKECHSAVLIAVISASFCQFFSDTGYANACVMQSVHPGDLKSSVERYLNELLDPVRAEFSSAENQRLIKAAYPSSADGATLSQCLCISVHVSVTVIL